jgi:hypothetical protein
LSFSCDDEDKEIIIGCGVENPAENLPWLKERIDSFDQSAPYYQYLYVLQGKYLGETVFVFNNCCPFCTSIPPVYNCEGELLWYASEYPDREITDFEIVWKPLGFQCTL